jgi:hypothetical protein
MAQDNNRYPNVGYTRDKKPKYIPPSGRYSSTPIKLDPILQVIFF